MLFRLPYDFTRLSVAGISGISLPSMLQILHQRFDPDVQCGGDAQEGVQADPLLATFYFADIDRVQARFLGQLFLAPSGADTVLPDGFSQDFE